MWYVFLGLVIVVLMIMLILALVAIDSFQEDSRNAVSREVDDLLSDIYVSKPEARQIRDHVRQCQKDGL